MAYENIILEIDGGTAVITFNRPKALNALSPALLNEFDDALKSIAVRSDIGVVILTGSGEKAFVAGADIASMKELSAVEGLAFAKHGQTLYSFIETMPQIVIAAVNGFCLGGGCELTLACDLVVASENAKFGQPEVNLGIIPGFGGTQRLPRLVGRNVAKELIFTGGMISAQRAYEIGLANKVVPHAEILAEAKKLAATILSKGPVAIRTSKDAINHGMNMSLAEGCAYEAALFGVGFGTTDKVEGITAFLEKRPAAFTGK